MTDLWQLLIKAPVFGLIIAMAGCFQGMQVEGECRGGRPADHHRRRPGDLPGHRPRRLLRRLLHRDRLAVSEDAAIRSSRSGACSNSFGDQVIHEDLDLDVRRGEILGVVGGSGTGKSVLMRSIIGLQTPDAGEVEVFGEPMIGRDEEEAKHIRRRWGILFQGGALFSTLTVAENVQVPIREFYPGIDRGAARRDRRLQDRR